MRRIIALLGLVSSNLAFAQQPTTALASSSSATPSQAVSGAEKNELKYKLNESGSHFFKVTFLNQTWLRFNQSNPGTTVVSEPKASTFDIGLRRTRIQMFGQINDHVVLYLQFGLNNFNFQNGFPSFNTTGTPSNRKVQAFFHDAVGEYLVWKNKDYLKIGAGLTIVNGLSRFSQPSVSSIMSMDVPVFAQATVDQTDEFSRKLSVYARGQVGPIDYRFAVSDPFPIQTSGSVPPALGPNANFALKGHHKQLQGLVLYQFFDKESNQTPGYMTGTYLGGKKILNLEAGFVSQKNALWHTGEMPTDTVYQNLKLWSVAAFLDAPVNRATGSAISAYLGYFNLDYGKNYLRYNGIMNPATGTTQGIAGLGGTQGNAFPMFGTGSVLYAQVGYLFRQSLLGSTGTLLPYAQAQIGNYNRVQGSMGVYNVGLNWLIKGHNSKLTLDYQNRPYYQALPSGQLESSGRRGQIVLQYQVFI